MKKTRTLPRKLELSTETIKKLTPEQLLGVDGGRPRLRPNDVSTVVTSEGC